MNVLIVYWHPEPQSFNKAMFNTAVNTFTEMGATVKTSDLYAMKFDPESSRKNFTTVSDPDFLKLQLEELHATKNNGFTDDLEAEIAKLEWCDIMIWQFPLWWFGLPGVFKGWVDRVLPLGRCYSHSKSFENGIFAGKKALLSVTTGGSKDAYEEGGFMGELSSILKPLQRGVLEFTGWGVLQTHAVHAPVRMTQEEREQELANYAERLKNLANEQTVVIGGF